MRPKTDYDRAVLRYCVGSLVAAALTVCIYVIVQNGTIAEGALLATIILLFAFIQFCVQIVVFLPVKSRKNKKPNWKLHSLWFVIITILIIVVGSLWIMKNLDYNMGMDQHEMHEYMLKENQKGF